MSIPRLRKPIAGQERPIERPSTQPWAVFSTDHSVYTFYLIPTEDHVVHSTAISGAGVCSRMSTCDSGNEYNGKLGLRISSIFVILVGSFWGAWFPVFAARHRGVGVPEWAFFVAKYFGSGVIVATAFIHVRMQSFTYEMQLAVLTFVQLLAPANEALTNPCLTGPITEYSWVEGICLMSVFALFFVELITMRYAKFGHGHGNHSEHHGHTHGTRNGLRVDHGHDLQTLDAKTPPALEPRNEDNDDEARSISISEPYAAQLTGVFILEFGVIFHSVFIGLTLAVAGKEFDTLYVVLVFHQTFEGLALGSRFASIDWPKARRWTPYALGTGFAISTPLAIAVGLGVRSTYHPGSATALITNGVFDSISAGILIYTGLVELMAHDFIFSSYMQRAPVSEMLYAFATMCCGAGLMALLGRWA